MATVTGYVERIKYRNEDNGYSVLSVADGGEEYILVGTFPYISEGNCKKRRAGWWNTPSTVNSLRWRAMR